MSYTVTGVKRAVYSMSVLLSGFNIALSRVGLV